jgi:hypothetical protein
MLYSTILYYTMIKKVLNITPKSKKEQIWKLALDDKLTPDEIALKVDTTRQNVWKEISILRSKGGLAYRKTTAQQSNKSEMIFLNPGEEQNSAGILGLSKIRHRTPTSVNDLIDVPELDSAGLKILYGEFRSGKKPIDILAEYGYHPEIVEIEYQRFMQFSERDYGDLMKRIILTLKRKGYLDECGRNEKIKALIKLYRQRGYLTNTEILNLLELYVQEEVQDKTDLMLIDTERRLPNGFSRIRCCQCKGMLGDAILSDKLPLGKKLLEEYDEKLLCGACRHDPDSLD